MLLKACKSFSPTTLLLLLCFLIECGSLIKEVVRDVGSGLAGLRWKSMLMRKLFTISRALANSGRGSPCKGQKGPRCQNFGKQKIKDTVNTFY